MSAIDDKYASLGGAGGVLGAPTSAELSTPDGVGRFRHFKFGSIYWTPTTGAHEVHGAIHALWSSLGWELSPVGYPTTDETATPDGVGRFNHFQLGSVYWHPTTGAHEVHGAIHTLWSSLGWELSPLGYPLSNEEDTEHGFGKVSKFQRGAIYWDGGRGAYEVYPRPAYPPRNPATAGQWVIPQYNSGIVGMHAALLHTHDVLFLAYREPTDPDNPGPIPPDLGDSAVLDLDSHTISTPTYQGPNGQTQIPNIFCSGHSLLADGRLLVVGGDRENQTRLRSVHLFTPGPAGGSWKHVAQLAQGRWYPSVTTLPDGRALMVGGEKRILNDPIATRNTSYEIFNPSTGKLGAAVPAPPLKGFDQWISYPFVFVLPTRKLLMHGGTRTVFLDLTTFAFDGTALNTAPRPAQNSRTYGLEGTSALLPLQPNTNPPYRARVMVFGGGGANPITIRTPATNSCEILDMGAQPLAWKLAAPMVHPRVMPDAVLLPDATVLVMNGSSAGFADNGANPVWEAERYNPATNTWTTMAPMNVPRLYHATALLLPDATVLTAGTDSVWNPDPFHHAEVRVEVFSPPYLFTGGPRPAITSAPAEMPYGGPYTLQTPDASSITSISLLRCGSATHSFNSDQRYVGLEITGRAGTSLTLQTPPDGFVAPPGYYMLFILRDGVPSKARIVRLA